MQVICFLLWTLFQATHSMGRQLPLKAQFVDLEMKNGDILTGLVDNNMEAFKGIPFVEPPVGDLRFRPSVPFTGSLNGFQATAMGKSCYPLDLFNNIRLKRHVDMSLLSGVNPEQLDLMNDANIGEDCLTLNIYRPAGIPKDAKLPVMVWVYSGAFQFGSTSFYPGRPVVEMSMKMKTPVIFVTVGYRLGPWGFLGGDAIGKEGSTNAAMWDLINGFRWIQENIDDFGGDPEHVTAWGESAGGMLVSHLMITEEFKRKPLFASAISMSGNLLPFGNATGSAANDLFWTFARAAGCSDDVPQDEALACLRGKDSETLYNAQNYDRNPLELNDLATAFTVWAPKPDGVLWEGNAYQNALKNGVVDIPFITGNQEDEGTLISFVFGTMSKAATDERLTNLFPRGGCRLKHYLEMYPTDLAAGCPYRTRWMNELWPNYKRLSSLLTDLIFVIPRRIMQKAMKYNGAPRYVYFSDALHNVLPFLGTTHFNDVIYIYHFQNSQTARAYLRYFISFANFYDPNQAIDDLPEWPMYDEVNRTMLHFSISKIGTATDDYRKDITDFATQRVAMWETD